MSKISSKPPMQTASDFIAKSVKESTDNTCKPWQNAREDMLKTLSLQLHEEYILKLKYISQQTNISQQKLAKDMLYPAIDEMLQNLD